MNQLRILLVTGVCLLSGIATRADSPFSNLRAVARHGQVFLTWREQPAPESTTLNVYVAQRPITDVSAAKLAARGIERQSGRDWWQDPASFKKGEKPAPPIGFLVEDDGRPPWNSAATTPLPVMPMVPFGADGEP